MTHISCLIGGSPLKVTHGEIVAVFASQSWKPETRKGYRNTITSFFGWMQASGLRDDDPSNGIPRAKRPKPHPRPCPDRVILEALGKATSKERMFAERFTHWPTQINGTELNGTEDNAQAAKECLAG